MPFEVGNKLGSGANHKRREIITQQLVAELQNAEGAELRKVVIALLGQAKKGDVPAIKEIFDRVEGKVTQPHDQSGSFKIEVSWPK